MTLTFEKLATKGLADEEQADVLGNHLAAALERYIETFGADRPARVSFVLVPEDMPSGGSVPGKENEDDEEETEYGEAYLVCEEDEAPFAVKIDICTMSPAELSDQGDEEDEEKSADD